mmetsp:Transcript_3048/g.8275  ORF Transcript_3048/g.8275 Transcript_3048/m.8275 type:complete len:484 (+) Transcript_3048:158-1609(+)
MSTKHRRRDGICYDGFPFSPNLFLHEEIQPTIARSHDFHSTYKHSYPQFSHTQKLLTKESKKSYCSSFCTGLIQQHMVQPRRLTTFQSEQRYHVISNVSETKKRSRSSSCRTTSSRREPKVEIRIEGDTTNDIINEIKLKSFDMFTNESSSVLLKGIRGLPSCIVSTRDDMTKEAMLLLSSLKDLVKNKGSSWKIMKIQECSPVVVEVLIASLISSDFEEIHIVGMCDDELYEADENLKQIEPSSASHSSSIAGSIDPRMYVSFLITSLLKKTNRIKKLVLQGCNLDNMALNQIMNILCSHPNHPKSLEYLDLRFNKFTPIAIQSVLAIHLKSSLHSLKTVKLRQGLRCVVNENTRDAILQSLRCNRVVLEYTDIFDWDKSVQYLLDINRAKRRSILCNNDRFPRSLWPLLLGQVVVVNEGEDTNLTIKHTKSQYQSPPFVSQQVITSTRRRQASVIYHIFRNSGAMLLQQHYHPSMDRIGLD